MYRIKGYFSAMEYANFVKDKYDNEEKGDFEI